MMENGLDILYDSRLCLSTGCIDVNNFEDNEFRDHRRFANFCNFFRNGSYERSIGLQTAVARPFSW